jgi:hypothetical protein
VQRWQHRLILALPLPEVAAGIIAPDTAGVPAMGYVVAATGWWAGRTRP